MDGRGTLRIAMGSNGSGSKMPKATTLRLASDRGSRPPSPHVGRQDGLPLWLRRLASIVRQTFRLLGKDVCDDKDEKAFGQPSFAQLFTFEDPFAIIETVDGSRHSVFASSPNKTCYHTYTQ